MNTSSDAIGGRSVFLAASAVLCLFLSAAAQAAGTLEQIAQSGVIKLGYREASSPFSYLDGNQRPVGYSLDICYRIVEVIKRELKRPDLSVKHVPVTSANRIPLVISGDVDLECGSTTSTADRRQQVAFTIPTYIAASRLLVRSDSNIRSVLDLAGKKVVTTKGSSQEKLFNGINESRSLAADFVLTKEFGEAFAMVEEGKADAFIMDDIILASLRATSKNPEALSITRDPLTIEPLAIMMRKADPAFKKLVDTEVARLITQGEINPIYNKWFESPIPPKQTNLRLPMSYMLRDSFKVPTDWLPM